MSAVELSLTDIMDKLVVDDWGQCAAARSAPCARTSRRASCPSRRSTRSSARSSPARKPGRETRRRDDPALAPRPVPDRHRARARDAREGGAPRHRPAPALRVDRAPRARPGVRRIRLEVVHVQRLAAHPLEPRSEVGVRVEVEPRLARDVEVAVERDVRDRVLVSTRKGRAASCRSSRARTAWPASARRLASSSLGRRRPVWRRKRRPPTAGMTTVCSYMSQRSTSARSKTPAGRNGVESAR